MNATYSLAKIKELLAKGDYRITFSAIQSAKDDFGLLESEIVSEVAKLDSTFFYKTMEAQKASGLWQDVYRMQVKGIEAYIKLQINKDAIIISFKKK
ncbi:type II toxin-antitoxin system MqsR family toxin [Leptospira bandrabouensis]|uniref:type II toxin-antitoxin system MqsR family toxin n=1 Tax=Leptospira bandrabouensis TaxID=2484903 RepID=UPI0010916F6F|nr:type II toxin-antitoxin system MqsR family toxin [Leptospira bandrabouensis]TGN08604.1 type II toxin-antitoxin system MqsR family toxin [Leptospira bandrabouensis]